MAKTVNIECFNLRELEALHPAAYAKVRKLGASVQITRLLEDNTGMCRYRGVDYDFWLNEWGDIVTVKSA